MNASPQLINSTLTMANTNRSTRNTKTKVRKTAPSTPPNPRTKSERTRPEALKQKVTLRERVVRPILKIGVVRRWHIRRLLKFIDKSKAKGRRLPPNLYELNRFLSQVPKEQRAQRLEEAMTAQQRPDMLPSRDMRRASDNQSRRSGRGGSGYRPGLPARSMMPGPRPPKRPR